MSLDADPVRPDPLRPAAPGIVPIPLNELISAAATGAAAAGPAFDPTSSELHERAVFLVGAPRSGTTWLHQLLAVHPSISTSGESHVFCEGLGTVFANHDDDDPHMNLSTWVGRDELVGLARRFVDGLFLAVRARVRPEASHVLDKTPDHRPHAALLAEVYPDATFVHIVRDGRDMASSAHSLWAGIGSAYRSIGDAASVWAGAVHDIREHLSGLRYHEVRYEDLVADPQRGLAGVLDAIGLPHDPALLDAAVAFGRAPINVRPSDARTGARKWGALEPDAARAVVAAAGDLLVELGYLSEQERADALAHRSLALVSAEVVQRARELGVRATGRAARVRADRRSSRARARRDAVRSTGRQAAEGASTGSRSIAALFHHDAVVESEGSEPLHGAAGIERLLAVVGGGRITHVDADEQACAVQAVDRDGLRQLQRYYVRDGRIARVVVQGA